MEELSKLRSSISAAQGSTKRNATKGQGLNMGLLIGFCVFVVSICGGVIWWINSH